MAVSHVITWQLGMRFPRAFPMVFVVGFPKSGTTWACQLIGGYLQLPFPKLSLAPACFPAVVHGHDLVDRRYPYCVYVMRDGRDAMTSLYYHIRRVLLREKRWLPRKHHAIFLEAHDSEAIRKAFPRFLEIQTHRPLGSRHSWAEHVKSYLEANQPNLVGLKYEDLIEDGATVLARELSKLDGNDPNLERAAFFLEDFSFSRQTGRSPSSEDKGSFLRKGVSGDWRNHFTREAAEIFDHYCGETLVAAGYEKDRRWIDGLPTS